MARLTCYRVRMNPMKSYTPSAQRGGGGTQERDWHIVGQRRGIDGVASTLATSALTRKAFPTPAGWTPSALYVYPEHRANSVGSIKTFPLPHIRLIEVLVHDVALLFADLR